MKGLFMDISAILISCVRLILLGLHSMNGCGARVSKVWSQLFADTIEVPVETVKGKKSGHEARLCVQALGWVFTKIMPTQFQSLRK